MGLLSRIGSKGLDYAAFGGLGGAGTGMLLGGGAEAMGAPEGTQFGSAIAGAGLGALTGGGAGAMKTLIMAIAKGLKRQRPDLPDEAVIQEATRQAQTLDGRKLQELYSRNFGEEMSPDLADFHARNRG